MYLQVLSVLVTLLDCSVHRDVLVQGCSISTAKQEIFAGSQYGPEPMLPASVPKWYVWTISLTVCNLQSMIMNHLFYFQRQCWRYHHDSHKVLSQLGEHCAWRCCSTYCCNAIFRHIVNDIECLPQMFCGNKCCDGDIFTFIFLSKRLRNLVDSSYKFIFTIKCKLGQHCTQRCSGTWWCWAISRHISIRRHHFYW